MRELKVQSLSEIPVSVAFAYDAHGKQWERVSTMHDHWFTPYHESRAVAVKHDDAQLEPCAPFTYEAE